MSFSCPHFRFQDGWCQRVERPCVPGRPGCVLRANSVFAVPVEERLEDERERGRVPTRADRSRVED